MVPLSVTFVLKREWRMEASSAPRWVNSMPRGLAAQGQLWDPKVNARTFR